MPYPKRLWLAVVLVFCFAESALATRSIDCFRWAQTDYEQIYCEIKARGEGPQLPSFIDFRKNNLLTQYLLLKRPAESLRIPLAKATSSATPKVLPEKPYPPGSNPASSRVNHNKSALSAASPDSAQENCVLSGPAIRCGALQYQLVGNRHNRDLAPGALDQSKRIGLSAYSGSLSEQGTLNKFLWKNYVLYLERMLDIGLGGVTMCFTKFHYLFHDLYRKGVSFTNRFETMYQFLKKDKASNAVQTAIYPLEGVDFSQCQHLTDLMIACDNVRLNRIYLRSDN